MAGTECTECVRLDAAMEAYLASPSGEVVGRLLVIEVEDHRATHREVA